MKVMEIPSFWQAFYIDDLMRRTGGLTSLRVGRVWWRRVSERGVDAYSGLYLIKYKTNFFYHKMHDQYGLTFSKLN